MENASKALIIAGAILLAILLISLGIMIFSQAQDTVSNSGMNEAQKTSFNNKMLKYEGKQKGTVVKAMVNEIIAMNADPNNSDRKIQVKITNSGSAGTMKEPTTTSDVETANNYTVTLAYDSSTGLVNKITATKTTN